MFWSTTFGQWALEPPTHSFGRQKGWPNRRVAVAIAPVSTSPEELQHTPLVDQHVRLGGRMVPYAGWLMPVMYGGIVAEHNAVRNHAGIFDVSHMGRLEIVGEDALVAVNRLITNDLERVADGRALYACCCNADGGILDDLIAYRQSLKRVLVICNAANHAKVAAHFAQTLGQGAKLQDISQASGLLALQGPSAVEVIRSLGLSAAATLPKFSFCEENLGSVRVVAARTGYTGEDGFEIVVPAQASVSIWNTLLEAGAPFGVVPVGLGARDTLRLEACLSLYGHEIDESTHPFEAGLGFAVRLEKRDFIGQPALVRIRNQQLERKLVGFVMRGRGIARERYTLLDTDGKPVGKVTSGAPAPALGKNIGLGYVPIDLAPVGTTILVDCRGKCIEAEVVRTPFYKRTTLH